MLRYSHCGIGKKDMTYLILFIALGLLSGIEHEYYRMGSMRYQLPVTSTTNHPPDVTGMSQKDQI
jgi:hypothetical protein